MAWDLLDDLPGTLALWRGRRGADVRLDPADVAEAATRALVAGLDSPSLRELAGLYADADEQDTGPLVDVVIAELGLDLPAGDDLVVLGFLHVVGRRALTGAIAPRWVTAWAHGHVGHDGPASMLGLVVADDEYDDLDILADWGGDTRSATEAQADLAALDARVLASVQHLLDRVRRP